MRKSLLFFLLWLVSALLCAGSALALTATVIDNGGNSVSIDLVDHQGTGNWLVGMSETFYTTTPISTQFTQESGQSYSGEVLFQKTVTNSTDFIWQDFHMKLWVLNQAGEWVPSPNNDGLYFTGIGLSGPFTQTWYDPNAEDELWLWNGVWNSGDFYTLTFSVGGWGWNNGTVPNFRLEQWPTDTGGPSVPEPATMLLLGLGLMGLAGFRRKFKN